MDLHTMLTIYQDVTIFFIVVLIAFFILVVITLVHIILMEAHFKKLVELEYRKYNESKGYVYPKTESSGGER